MVEKQRAPQCLSHHLPHPHLLSPLSHLEHTSVLLDYLCPFKEYSLQSLLQSAGELNGFLLGPEFWPSSANLAEDDKSLLFREGYWGDPCFTSKVEMLLLTPMCWNSKLLWIPGWAFSFEDLTQAKTIHTTMHRNQCALPCALGTIILDTRLCCRWLPFTVASPHFLTLSDIYQAVNILPDQKCSSPFGYPYWPMLQTACFAVV